MTFKEKYQAGEIEFEAIRKLNKSVEYIQSGQFQKDYEAEKWLDKHMD